MAPILDANTLRMLFNSRYMDFKTCTSLLPVSSQFNFYASNYLLAVKDFDLSFLSKNIPDDSECLYDLYSCLIGALGKYCPNLEKIVGVRIWPEKFNLVSRGCLEQLPNLTSISVEDDYISMTVLFNFLKPLPRLRSVRVGNLYKDWNGEGDEIENVATEEDKLAVQELSLKADPFWRLFRTDSLKKLRLWLINMLPGDDFLDSLSLCQNLERLEMEFFASLYGAHFYSRLSRVVDALPHLKQFTVNLSGDTSEVHRFLSSCPRMGTYVTRLTMPDTDLNGWRRYFFPISDRSNP